MEGVVMIKCGVFKILSKNTSQYYIGASKNIVKMMQTIRFRLKNDSFYNSKLQIVYNKYGPKGLVYSILELCEEENLQRTKEIYLTIDDVCFNKVFLRIKI